MDKKKLLGLGVTLSPKHAILEQIKKYLLAKKEFIHIVSLNPENYVIASEDPEFNHVVKTAQIVIPDGIGIVLAARIKGLQLPERVAGVDLMFELIKLAGNMRLTVLFVGGRPNLALRTAECQRDQYPEAKFIGTMGFSDIKNPLKFEENNIFDIVRRHKPHLILAAFGSPWQELWLARHSKELKGIVCMGVGGGLDVAGGIVARAPKLIQNIGLEWLYRLLREPWRWRRQLRLIKFGWLVLTNSI